MNVEVIQSWVETAQAETATFAYLLPFGNMAMRISICPRNRDLRPRFTNLAIIKSGFLRFFGRGALALLF
jgi:hypothetical protein